MTDRSFDEEMMALALRVGARGRPSPNPHVGAVIVRDGRVLSTGYHEQAGRPHAEVNALSKLGGRAEGATLYVTLEPCNHHGRTGPCSEAVLAAGIRRVVIGRLDEVPGHGGGAERLRHAGIEVEVLLAREAEALTDDFFKHARTGLPWVTLKAAVTLDGYMAARGGDSRWITGEEARAHAHRLRDRNDAILVGVGTLLADDPALTVRHVPGRDPIRIVLDTHLNTPSDAQVLEQASDAPTWIFHGPGVSGQRAEALRSAGADLFELPVHDGSLSLDAALRFIGSRGVVRLLVEGGPTIHGALLDARLVDEAAIFTAPKLLGDASAMPLALGRARERMGEAVELVDPSVRLFGRDVFTTGRVRYPAERG